MKAPYNVQLRHDSRRRVSLRHADRFPMTSSRCQLTWCDKVADSSSFCRASFWTPLDRRRHVTAPAAKPEVDSPPALFATPTSGGFVSTSVPHLRTPTYDFVFDVDMTRRRRQHFRSPYCLPPSCHVMTEIVDGAKSIAPSPTDEVVPLPAHAHRYAEGNVDDSDRQTEVGRVNSS